MRRGVRRVGRALARYGHASSGAVEQAVSGARKFVNAHPGATTGAIVGGVAGVVGVIPGTLLGGIGGAVVDDLVKK